MNYRMKRLPEGPVGKKGGKRRREADGLSRDIRGGGKCQCGLFSDSGEKGLKKKFWELVPHPSSEPSSYFHHRFGLRVYIL
jgi:hypothetical protein